MTASIGSIARLAAAGLAAYGRPAVGVRAISVRTIVAAVCSVLAVWLGLAGFSCFAAALWIFTQPPLGTLGATLVTASALLAVCVALAATAYAAIRPRSTTNSAQAPQASPDELIAQGLQLFKEHKGTVLLTALVAGMMTETNSRS